jgi:hypothetical protein
MSRPRLDDELLYELVELRRSQLSAHLDLFSLETVDQVACLTRGKDLEPVGDDRPGWGGEGALGKRTQGIFGYNNRSKLFEKPGHNAGGTCYIWGLTREGKWVSVRVKFEDRGRDGNKDQHATDVHFRQRAGLAEMLVCAKVTPLEVFAALSRATDGWVEHRNRLLAKATNLQSSMRIEDDFVELYREMQP